ncbi:MAG: DNA translocase FtsK, partial [uncultured Solirubrobacteraceae bacterium]
RGPAARPARDPSVQGGRRLPLRRAGPRLRRGDVRPRPGRAARRVLGARDVRGPRRRGGGGPLLRGLHAAGGHRRAHPGGVPARGGRAAAHGRVRGGRHAGHGLQGRGHHAGAAPRAARARGGRGRGRGRGRARGGRHEPSPGPRANERRRPVGPAGAPDPLARLRAAARARADLPPRAPGPRRRDPAGHRARRRRALSRPLGGGARRRPGAHGLRPGRAARPRARAGARAARGARARPGAPRRPRGGAVRAGPRPRGPRRRRGPARRGAGRAGRGRHGGVAPPARGDAARPLLGRERPPGHGGPGRDGGAAHRGPAALQRGGEGRRHGGRPAHHPLRAAPGARREDEQGRGDEGRPGLRAGRHGHPDPRPDPRQAGRGRRGPEPQAQDGHARRRLRRGARGLQPADGLARQGRERQGDPRRPGQDAAHPRGRHHGRGQVRLHQRDALEHPPARHPGGGPPRPRGPQAGRAQPLRGDPAPPHAGHHVPALGGQRAAEPRPGDGVALRDHVHGPHPLPARAQQAPARQGREGAAVHPLRHRRARGPHDGGPRGRRGLDHPHRPEGPRGRHPPRPGHAVPARGRHHGHDQGQRPVADRLQRLLPDGLPGHPRPERRRVAARHGGHAVLRRRVRAPAPHPGRVHRRGADRRAHGVLGHPGRARAARGPPRGGRGGGRRRRRGGARRLRSRRGPAPGRRHRARGGDGHGVHLDAPAPPAPGLHPRRAAHRHARAPRGHLGLRGLQAPPGARDPGRPAAGPGRPGRAHAGRSRGPVRGRGLRHPRPPARAGRPGGAVLRAGPGRV